MNNQLLFYRSMCVAEYRYHQSNGFFWKGTEWAEPTLEREEDGVPLSILKGWVDRGRSSSGPHDLVVRVSGHAPTEFVVNHAISAKRYVNLEFIPFERTEIVYDPRAVVSEEPVNLLEELL